MSRTVWAAVLVAAAMPAFATTQTLVLTGDLTQGGPTPNYAFELAGTGFSPPFDVKLAVGDVLDLTMNFLPGQSLTITAPTMFWAFSFANVASDVQGTGQLTLLDTAGAPLLISDMKSNTEGVAHFGQSFYAADFAGGLPPVLILGGLHYVGTVNAYLEPGVTERQYYDPHLALMAESATVNGAGVVSEPSPGMLLMAGLAAVALLKRRAR